MTTFLAVSWSILVLASAPAGAGTQSTALAHRIATAWPDEHIPVDIVLAEQTDTARIDAAAETVAKRARRELVVALLRDTAARSQAQLVEFLEAERATGGDVDPGLDDPLPVFRARPRQQLRRAADGRARVHGVSVIG